jgi:DNA (cytosine-5)-methyltransferase 1
MAKVTNQMLTVSQAASRLGVSVDTVRRWTKKGLIKASSGTHGERLFDLAELERHIAKNSLQDRDWRVLKASSSNLSAIELFCGAGGLALGLSNAGLKTELLVDFDRDSVSTIKTNRPKWNSRLASVTELDLAEYRGAIDVLAGGFPCQAFSYAGHKLGFADIRGTLFYEFARLIEQVNPRIVLGENVRGLLNHDDGRTLRVMTSELERLGYRVAFRVLRSQFLDVPQKRERLIIFGLRSDVDSQILFPVEKNYTISLRAALSNVPKSQGQIYSAAKLKVMQRIPEGGYWRDLPEKLQRQYMGASFFMGGGKTGMARRLAWDEPSLTLTCNPAQKQTERCHPVETRPLTTREYARIQCFPDDWEFSGSVSSVYRQIGNAVPVNLGYHIGLAVRTMLGEKPRRTELPAELAPLEESDLRLF